MSKSAALERATCESCGTAFTRAPGEDWKRLCLSCWKASPVARKAAPDRLAQLTAELAEARAEADRLRCRVLSLEQSAIPPDMLKRLLSLAHPDKHNGSRIATEATQWLLAHREAAR